MILSHTKGSNTHGHFDPPLPELSNCYLLDFRLLTRLSRDSEKRRRVYCLKRHQTCLFLLVCLVVAMINIGVEVNITHFFYYRQSETDSRYVTNHILGNKTIKTHVQCLPKEYSLLSKQNNVGELLRKLLDLQ